MKQVLTDWFSSPPGQYLMAAEQAVADAVMPQVFGLFLLQIGSWCGSTEFVRASPVRHKLVLNGSATGADMLGDACCLPVSADSIDVVVLPHTLENIEDPARALRECERILSGEGHVMIFGFNPLSAWGLHQLIRPEIPWAGRYLSERRLSEWLTVLGFDLVARRRYLYRPPLATAEVFSHFEFLDRWGRLGRSPVPAGAYMLLARKRVFCMTPMKPRWMRKKQPVGALVKPTTSSMQ